MQQRVRGSVENRYPAGPAALLADLEREREMRRHEASDAAAARRAAELDGNGFESDGYLIRPAATVREIPQEANAQHNCVAGFIDKYASGQTDLWLMRKCSDPGTPLVTVEVRGGTIRQPFQSHNRQVTAAPLPLRLVRGRGLPHADGRKDARWGGVAQDDRHSAEGRGVHPSPSAGFM